MQGPPKSLTTGHIGLPSPHPDPCNNLSTARASTYRYGNCYRVLAGAHSASAGAFLLAAGDALPCHSSTRRHIWLSSNCLQQTHRQPGRHVHRDRGHDPCQRHQTRAVHPAGALLGRRTHSGCLRTRAGAPAARRGPFPPATLSRWQAPAWRSSGVQEMPWRELWSVRPQAVRKGARCTSPAVIRMRRPLAPCPHPTQAQSHHVR